MPHVPYRLASIFSAPETETATSSAAAAAKCFPVIEFSISRVMSARIRRRWVAVFGDAKTFQFSDGFASASAAYLHRDQDFQHAGLLRVFERRGGLAERKRPVDERAW